MSALRAILDWFAKPLWPKRKPGEPSTVVHMTTRPLVVATGDEITSQDVQHARYRLDAIKRYIEQNPHRSFADHHIDEFKAEAIQLSGVLRRRGKLNDIVFDDFLRQIDRARG